MMILESVILRSLFRLIALRLYFRQENTVRHETKQSAITDCFVFAHKTNGEHGSPLQLNNYFVTFIRFVFIIVYMPLLAGIRKTINAKLLQK